MELQTALIVLALILLVFIAISVIIIVLLALRVAELIYFADAGYDERERLEQCLEKSDGF